MIWLPLLALLGAVDAGLAKPYCSWHDRYGCLETSDNHTSTCGHSKYTDLVINLQACLNRQTRDFTGCKEPEPDSDQTWNCSTFEVSGVYTSTPPPPTAPQGFVCLPSSDAPIDELDQSSDVSGGDDVTAFRMVATLERVNLCEGRELRPDRLPVKSGKDSERDAYINISAPCTCLGPIGDTDACRNITVLPEARAQCDLCKNDLDTWISDFLLRRDCVATIADAAPLQALCRAQKNQETCEGLNDLCGDACGRPESSPQSPMRAEPVSDLTNLLGSNGMQEKQTQDAGEMSAAATVRGSMVAVAVVAAVGTALLAAWGG